ncbi:MAG: polysaccharide pyruvyl transferase family protein [Microbacteriaceae bacterium]
MVPAKWKKLSKGEFHTFNPALIANGDGFVMAYRFVSNSDLIRRIAMCRLDADMNVIPGSAVDFSDLIEFADPAADERSREWFADPRLFQLLGKTWMVWNDGNRSDGNHQFMVEVTVDGALAPAAAAREITIKDGRRKNEKNWAFFEADGKVWVVYSITPHQILSADLTSSDTRVICQSEVAVEWNARYSETFGALRGGAQPVRVGDRFINLVHSSFNMPDGREYVAAVYEFAAKFPFAPVRELPVPVKLNTPKPAADAVVENSLNPTTSHVVYPTGLVINGDKVNISAGVNDSDLSVIAGTLSDLTAGMVPARIKHTMQIDRSAGRRIAPMSVPAIEPKIPVFWWHAKGNLMNGKISNALFKHGNFGDDASPLLVTDLTSIRSRRVVPGDRKLLAIGSILHRANDGDIIWGSGLKSDDALDSHPGGNILVTAVRGPKTLKVLKKAGWDTSRITEMFDPGVLLRHLYADRLASFDVNKNKHRGTLRVIPHFKDELVFKRQRPDLMKHFISADGDPVKILEAMLGAELVISSSLHGIIFAESLGIPAIWIDSPGGEGHFKYLDYYEGTGRKGIKAARDIDHALTLKAPALPTFDFEKLLATFPAAEIAELAQTRRPKAAEEMVGQKARGHYREDFEHSTSRSIVTRGGELWVVGTKGTVALAPLDIDGEYSAVKLRVKPAVVKPPKNGFTVVVAVDGGASVTAHWANGSRTPQVIQLPVSKQQWNAGVTVTVKANTVGMGGGRIHPLNVGMSVGIMSIGAALPG